MTSNTHLSLLDRVKPKADIEAHFKDALNLLKELVDYGTTLIEKTYFASEKKPEDAIVICVLLKQVVAMLDAEEILVSEAAVYAAHLQARAAFEASIYIEWILKEDSENRAKHYLVSNFRNERNWALRGIKGTEEKAKFDSSMEQLLTDFETLDPNFEQDARRHLEEVNRILGQPELKPVDDLFEKLKINDKRHLEPAWYKPLKVHSARQIAKCVGRLPEYDLFYAIGSEVTHSASYKYHIRFGKNKIHLKQIRYLEHIHSLLNFTIANILKTYRIIITKYIPDELKDFWIQYSKQWREPFLSIKRVNYVVENDN